MPGLADYLAELRSLPEEKPLQPELKAQRQEHDRKIREEQDLAAGAVLTATVEPGEGEAQLETGDLVYIQYSIKDESGETLFSTRSEEGGTGHAFSFRLGKGLRAPRGLEIALMGMKRGERTVVKVRKDYGFQHPDCSMPPPKPDIPLNQTLTFDVHLLNWYPSKDIRVGGSREDAYRRVIQEGSSWESPRPPFEVRIHVTACCPAYDGLPLSGYRYFSTEGKQPLSCQLGQGALPAGLEDALAHMSQGEVAEILLPAETMRSEPSSGAQSLMPAAPAKAQQVELLVGLLDMVHVRDMTGTGEVLKKRLREGKGDFPIDCPLSDTTVRVHYKVRAIQDGQPGDWVFDSRRSSMTSDVQATLSPKPVEFDTGCGEMPEGLEMSVKLMLPGELALVQCQPRFAYQGRQDAPAGVDPDNPVEFEVQLVSFEKEGHWQTMEFPERWALADRLKAKGNELYKQKKYAFAKGRYERLLRLLESTRDFEEEEQMAACDTYKVAVLSNLALVALAVQDYTDAVEQCSKALEYDASNAKLLFRRGKARSLKGDHEEAEADMKAALELDPSIESDVTTELAANKQRLKAALQKQKQQFKNFFER